MKILFFGNSHVGAFKKGFDMLSKNPKKNDLEKQFYDFYAQNEVYFISTPGPNWDEVTFKKDSTIIGIPEKTYKHTNGVRTDKVNNSYAFNSFNTLDYNAIVFCKGSNIVNFFNSFSGTVNPPLLTSSLLEILLKNFLSKNQEFKTILSSNNKSRFIYAGRPVPFSETRREWRNSTGILETRSRNLSFLRDNIYGKSSYDFLIPPSHCIDSAGRFTFDRYGRNPGQDENHANDNYGIEMLGELKKIL